MTEEIFLRMSDGEELPLFIDRPDNPSKKTPAVIVAHGFKGFATWGFFPFVAERLADAGFTVIRLNFSHNGTDGHGPDFPRLDRFEKNTFGREVRELGELFDAVVGAAGPFAEIAQESVFTLGHSRGGGIALLHAATEPRLAGVITWASVASFARFSDRQLDQWRTNRYLEIQNSRTNQTMRLGEEMLQEFESPGDFLDIIGAVRSLERPLLIVHGEVDLTVSIVDAERIDESVRSDCTRLVRVPRTGHTFGVVHPFGGSTPALEQAIDATLSFLQNRVIPAER